MGVILSQLLEGVALVAILVVVFLVIRISIVAARRRRPDERLVMRKGVRVRLDVIERDPYRVAESAGILSDMDVVVGRPFELGLAAMASCEWDQAAEQFAQAKAAAGGAELAALHNQVGVCRYFQGRCDDALREFEESARLAAEHGPAQGRAPAYNNIGVIRRDGGKFAAALKLFGEALDAAREAGQMQAAALSLDNIGSIWREKGEFDKALAFHEEALASSRTSGDRLGTASSLANIGRVRRAQGSLDKALEHLAEAFDIVREAGHKLATADVLSDIGGVYRDKGDLERALEFHKNALDADRETGYWKGVATELGNIGLILVGRDMHEQAVTKLAESLITLQTVGAVNGPRQVLIGLSKCDDRLGRARVRQILREAGLGEAEAADILDRIDLSRERRPRRKVRR